MIQSICFHFAFELAFGMVFQASVNNALFSFTTLSIRYFDHLHSKPSIVGSGCCVGTPSSKFNGESYIRLMLFVRVGMHLFVWSLHSA